jgi:riboflavin-specific deaminase-like protein
VQLIHPERRPTSPEELASNLRLHELAPPDRPYLGLNMVSSLDGKATLDWRTKGLSSDVDRRLFHHLRTQADAVMVGAGTVREERYGRMTKNEELRDKRVAEGRAPEALAVVVSGRLDLPADLPLLGEPEQEVLVATGAEHSLEGVSAQLGYARVGDDLQRLMAILGERGVRSVLCEGGPTLNSYLFAAGLVDELFLTLNPKAIGGASAITIVAGRELVEPTELDLVSVAEAGGELYTRWRVVRQAAGGARRAGM